MTRGFPLRWFFLVALVMVLILPGRVAAEALTVTEVARDLACPCQCPLVLEDCNMSCGLAWKNQIGELIAKGMTKQEIIDNFTSIYGDSAKLTPLQRIEGKIYQYTRGFDTLDWAMLWGGVVIWLMVVFFGIYLGVGRIKAKKRAKATAE
ncbi:MAG: cytochrome c-type biogenesis protein CcmH [Magnetococcales bacterium]|nr:cytochrome c-type biogenesis protein CcmH [Magnetococcales bacterium]